MPPPAGNTQVTVLLSTASNDQLSQYALNFQSLTLTSQSGKTVDLLTTAQSAATSYSPEFMHLNSNAQTLLTASVPDDTYASATLSVANASMTCISVNRSDGSLTTSTFAYGQTPQAQVTVNLASPIVVSGSAMNVSMQLDMAKSFTLADCNGGSTSDTYTITPTFDLAAADISSAPASYQAGKESDVLGQVSATSSSGFTVKTGYGYLVGIAQPTENISANASTVFQGISGIGDLKVGTFVDMDLAAQTDGSLAAMRISVADAAAVDVVSGPVIQTPSSVPSIFMFNQQVEGSDQFADASAIDISKASFLISGALNNTGSLPFEPKFDATNLVPGQNVYVTTPSTAKGGGVNNYPLSNTVTLMPQVLNGTVTASGSSGSFTTYTISLAPYDLFADLAGQQGSNNLIGLPSQVVVYVDGSTESLIASEPSVGAVYRFHGLVFNDGGTLRMDCDHVDSGVAL